MHEHLAALLASETRRVHQGEGEGGVKSTESAAGGARDVQLIRESLSLLCLLNAYGGVRPERFAQFWGVPPKNGPGPSKQLKLLP